jgi:hypothetical protein
MSEPGTLSLPEVGLSAEEATDRFARLQQKLVPLWTRAQDSEPDVDKGLKAD